MDKVQKVLFRDPHTGDVKEVDATPEAMTPVMVLGYVQVNIPAMQPEGETK